MGDTLIHSPLRTHTWELRAKIQCNWCLHRKLNWAEVHEHNSINFGSEIWPYHSSVKTVGGITSNSICFIHQLNVFFFNLNRLNVLIIDSDFRLCFCFLLICRDPLESQRRVAMISEMIHTASLIHDDVIDQSNFRRGKPSVNVLWNHRKVSDECIKY